MKAALLLLAVAAGAQSPAERAAGLAGSSARVSEAMEYLQEWANTVGDDKIREETLAVLREPWLGALARWKGREKELRDALKKEGFVDDAFAPPPNVFGTRAPQGFASAPGGPYEGGHHAHPGGLAVHTQVNLFIAQQYESAYTRFYGAEGIEADVLIAGTIWHDVGKPSVFQWKEDGSTLGEARIAGTGAHHVYGIAEAIHRGMPPLLVLAIAAAHSPADDNGMAALDGYLRAAEIVAGKPSGVTAALKRRLEPFLNHFADGDWRYTGMAQARVVDALRAKFGSRGDFNWRRNELGAKHTFEVLHRAIVDGRLDEAIK